MCSKFVGIFSLDSNHCTEVLPVSLAAKLHLVATKRNGKLYFPPTIIPAYLWHRNPMPHTHSWQVSQWNKVRGMEYSHRTKPTHWRAETRGEKKGSVGFHPKAQYVSLWWTKMWSGFIFLMLCSAF